MTRSSFLEKVQTSRGNLLYLIRGTDQGKAAWYYLEVDKKKLLLLEGNVKRSNGGVIDLEQYGTVIEYGWGENPPEDIKKRVIAKYN